MMNAGLRLINFFLVSFLWLFFAVYVSYAQQPQVSEPNPQTLQGYNSKWTNGVAPGFYPTCNPADCSTLTLSIGPGTCFDITGVRHTYAGGTLTIAASSITYIFLTKMGCALGTNTVSYNPLSNMPIATIVSGGSTITSIIDDRTYFGVNGGGPTAVCSSGISNASCAYYQNNSGGGTVINKPVKWLDYTTNQRQVTALTSADFAKGWYNNILGICISNCGNSGFAEVAYAGRAYCQFEAGSTPIQGHFVDIGANGYCLDDGTAGVNEDPNFHSYFAKVHTTAGTGAITDVDLLTVEAFGSTLYPQVPSITPGSPFIHNSPYYFDTVSYAGGTRPASTSAPIMASAVGHRFPSLDGGGTMDIYMAYSKAGTGSTQNNLIFDTSGTGKSNSAGAVMASCEYGCQNSTGTPTHAAVIYTPPLVETNWISASPYNLTDSGANSIFMTLAGNTSFNLIGLLPGKFTYWEVCQPPSGGPYSFSFPSQYQNAPTMTTSAGSCVRAMFWTQSTTVVQCVFGCVGGGGGGSGTVTSIICGTGLSGGTITTSGTCALLTPVAVANGGTGTTSAQGNGSKVQLSTGATITNDCVKFDANGNTIDAGSPCGTGGGGSGTVNLGGPLQMAYYNASGTTVDGLVTPKNLDLPPASAGSIDDEFNGSSLSGWTSVISASGTITESNGLISFAETSSGSDHFSYIYKTAPATTYTISTKCTPLFPEQNFFYGGIILSDSSGKVVMFQMENNNKIAVNYWNSATSFNSKPKGSTDSSPIMSGIWLRVKDDATNFTFYTSRDGLNWWKYGGTLSRTAFLTSGPTRVGLGMGNNMGSGETTYMSCDWIRTP